MRNNMTTIQAAPRRVIKIESLSIKYWGSGKKVTIFGDVGEIIESGSGKKITMVCEACLKRILLQIPPALMITPQEKRAYL